MYIYYEVGTKIFCSQCAKEYPEACLEMIDKGQKLPAPVGCERCGQVLCANLTDEGLREAREIVSADRNSLTPTDRVFVEQLAEIIDSIDASHGF